MRYSAIVALAVLATPAAAQRAMEIENGRGADGYVRVADDATLDLQRLTVDVTFQPRGAGEGLTTTGAGATLVAKPREGVAGSYIMSWWLGWSPVTGGVSALVSNDGDGTGVRADSACLVQIGESARATMTFDGAMLRLYINGGAVVETPSPFSTVYDGPNDLLFGASNFCCGYLRRFDGVIDDVSIWDRALSAGEVAALDAGALTGVEPGLVGLWTFEGDSLLDGTPNGNDGAASGAVGFGPGLAALAPCADCAADCDGNGALDFFDFLCFQNAFAVGDPYADCDETGVLDFFDFLCFQNAFAAGCP